jgi:hypothetical protein
MINKWQTVLTAKDNNLLHSVMLNRLLLQTNKQHISQLVTNINQIFSTVTFELLRAHSFPAVTFGK